MGNYLLKGTLAGLSLALAVSSVGAPANAAELVYLGTFDGNDCTGGGTSFDECYATQNGINVNGELLSPVVFKNNNGGELEVADAYEGIIQGDEFEVTFVDPTLSWTYDPDAGDPDIHYFTVKQGNQYALWYSSDALTSASVDLSATDLANDNGWSHVTWFNTGNAVPEPSTWAMLLFGFGGIGFAMRRRKGAPGSQRVRVTYA